MQATIYVTQEAMETANAIKDLDYYDRVSLSDDETTDLSMHDGYYLKNANKLHLAVLPASANVPICLSPDEPAIYHRHVSMPANLRGCIFEKAPHLPDGYAGIVTYWSGEPINTNTSGAAYFQCSLNDYMVDLTPTDANAGNDGAASVVMDNLLSEGVVVCIDDVESLIANLSLHDFIEIKLPINQSMLGIETVDFRSAKEYDAGLDPRCERIHLKVAEILRSPDRNRIFVDVLRHDLIDYGYWY
jgi:hypothetical protein